MDGFKEFQGKDLDDAIREACEYFNAAREKLEIEIVEDAKSGIFGIVGARKAKVRARRVELHDAVASILGADETTADAGRKSRETARETSRHAGREGSALPGAVATAASLPQRPPPQPLLRRAALRATRRPRRPRPWQRATALPPTEAVRPTKLRPAVSPKPPTAGPKQWGRSAAVTLRLPETRVPPGKRALRKPPVRGVRRGPPGPSTQWPQRGAARRAASLRARGF